ncbi:MAG TPA: putative 2OG-Fe(II) oxygenase [Steroidobacteraceae bacterium]
MQTRKLPGSPQAAVAAAYELVQRGALAEAEATCRQALALTGGRDPNVWTVLGVVLREQQRPAESEAAYRQALAVAPHHMPAHHNLGALLSYVERAEEALVALERARALGLRAPELHINRGRTFMQLQRLDEAEQAYLQAVALEPRNTSAQSNLAALRYMRGDPLYARDMAAAAAATPGDVLLQLSLADLMRRVGDLAGAESVLRGLLTIPSAPPVVRSALAVVLREGGRLKEAEALAMEAAMAQPQDTSVIENLVAIELALGRPEEALPFIRTQRLLQPQSQRWIAYQATAARQLGDPLYQSLYDYHRFVQVYELEPPAGWATMAELNAALMQTLSARHLFSAHPLHQSLRNGSQTTRSLTTDRDPVIQSLLSAFDAPIQAYRAAIGSDTGHPMAARNSGSAHLHGCWSVALRRDGFHVNHIHPQGWISSAYYVSVPEEVQDVTVKSGWIKFGEPRLPIPGATAEHFVQPRPGRLVLFPSYMWHGTNPIRGAEERLTVAFDAVPDA